MSPSSVIVPIYTLLLVALLLACGEHPAQRGRPAVALVGDAGPRSADGAFDASPAPRPAEPPPAEPDSGAAPAPGALCAPCTTDDDCDDPTGRCLILSWSGERFCSRRCDDPDESCPVGDFVCLSAKVGDERVRQCVPVKDTCVAGAPPHGSLCGPLESMRAYNLKVLNEIRVKRGLHPFEADACLDDKAQQGTLEWAAGGWGHGHFTRVCGAKALRNACPCNWTQENQGASWGQDLHTKYGWQKLIDKHMQNMMAEEPYNGGHFRNIVSTTWHRVGFGFLCKGDGAFYLTNDFGP